MGCDYYIYKILEVKNYEDYIIGWIELSKDKGYYPDRVWRTYSFDSDVSNYEEKVNIRKYKYLEVNYKPKILFENGIWINEEIENKYKHIITNNISTDNFNKLFTIRKIEYREER